MVLKIELQLSLLCIFHSILVSHFWTLFHYCVVFSLLYKPVVIFCKKHVCRWNYMSNWQL